MAQKIYVGKLESPEEQASLLEEPGAPAQVIMDVASGQVDRKKETDKAEKTLFVRIPPSQKDLVLDHARELGSERLVMQRLLGWFSTLPRDKRGELLEGASSVGEAGTIAALFAFADHAFTNHKYLWAIEIYQEIVKRFGSHKSLRLVAIYRLIFSFFMVARQLRKEALLLLGSKEDVLARYLRCYDLALKALTRAVYWGQQGKQLTQPLYEFNLSCALSFTAQATVERALAVQPACTWARALTDELLSGQIPEPNCIWKTAIGPQWRETLNKGPKARGQVFRTLVDIERVDEFARRAVNELTIPLSSKDGLNDDHDIPSPGSAYYRYSALVDQDLLFLRCDSVCLNSISNLLGTDADGALAHAAEHLLTGEPLS